MKRENYKTLIPPLVKAKVKNVFYIFKLVSAVKCQSAPWYNIRNIQYCSEDEDYKFAALIDTIQVLLTEQTLSW